VTSSFVQIKYFVAALEDCDVRFHSHFFERNMADFPEAYPVNSCVATALKLLKVFLRTKLYVFPHQSNWKDRHVRFVSGQFRAIGEVCHQLCRPQEALMYIRASWELKKEHQQIFSDFEGQWRSISDLSGGLKNLTTFVKF